MNVIDVATFCLQKQGPQGAMKLQKIVYYCQAWHLVALDEPLFLEEIQAWAYGPVVCELYKQHRTQFVVSQLDGDASQVVRCRPSCAVVEAVIGHYGAFDGPKLSDMTHNESPWIDAREMPNGYFDQSVITHHSMRKFYGKQKPPFILPSRENT